MRQTSQPKVTMRMILADRAVRTVILVSLVTLAGIGLIAPTLALFARSFGVGYGAAGLMLSAFGMARLISDLFAGPLIDRFGERRCATGGLLFLAACAAFTAIAPVYWLAVVLWGLGGGGSALAMGAQYSYLLKAAPKDRMARAMGIFYTAGNAGLIGGGAIGGLLADRLGLASPLFGFSILMVMAALMYMRAVPDLPPSSVEPPLETEEVLIEREAPLLRRTTGGLRELLGLRGFWAVLALNFAYFWVVAAVYETLVPLFGHDELGMSEAFIGTAFAVAVATEFFVLYPAGTAADRYGRKPVLVPSFAALGIMVAVLGLASTVPAYIVLMGVLGIAAGFAGVPPGAMLSDVAPAHRAGSAVGLFRFSGDLGWFLGPLLGSAAADVLGFKAAFAVAAVPVFGALAILLRTPETLRHGSAESGNRAACGGGDDSPPSDEKERDRQDHVSRD